MLKPPRLTVRREAQQPMIIIEMAASLEHGLSLATLPAPIKKGTGAQPMALKFPLLGGGG